MDSNKFKVEGKGRGRGRGRGYDQPQQQSFCPFFMKGNCKKGNNCNMPHINNNNNNNSNNNNNNFGNLANPEKKSQRPCKWGMNCYSINKGCPFVHEQSNIGMSDQNQGGGGFQHQGKEFKNLCQEFNNGKCDRIKCQKQHIFQLEDNNQQKTNIKIKILDEKDVFEQRTIITGSYINNKQQIVFGINDQKVGLFNVQTQIKEGEQKVDSNITAIKAFDDFPNTIFLGLEQKDLVNQTYTFSIILPNQVLAYPKAHQGKITDLEYQKINNVQYFFTSSLDNTIKCWGPSSDNQNLQFYTSQALNSEVNCLQFISNDMLICGLGDGKLGGWSLSAQSVNSIQIHNCEITCIKKHEGYLITGDKMGNMKILDINQNLSPVGEAQTATLCPITTLAVISPKNIPLLMGGDIQGYITLVYFNNNQPHKVSFGTHNDNKGPKGVAYSYIKSDENLCTIGNNGWCRNFEFS